MIEHLSTQPSHVAPTILAPSHTNDARISLTRHVAVFLITISSVITLISWLLWLYVDRVPNASSLWHWLHTQFHINNEHNIAALWGAFLWLLLALIATACMALSPRLVWSWAMFAAVAAYAALDEAIMIHEKFGRIGALVAPYVPGTIFSFEWVIVGIVVAAVVGAALMPLVLKLPRRSAAGIFAGGAVFLTATLVVETIGGFVDHYIGKNTVEITAILHVEEFLEYLGVTLAILALMTMIEVHRGPGGYFVRLARYRDEAARS